MPIYIDSVSLPASVEAGKPFVLSVSARHVPLTWGMLSDWNIKWEEVKKKTWAALDSLKPDSGN